MSKISLCIPTIGFLSLFLLAGCQKEESQHIPHFAISANEVEGLTTDIFTLSINPDSHIPANEKFHCRWDWEGDSIYDTRFSDDLEVYHRFYKPGNHLVICEVLSLSGGKAIDTILIMVDQGYSAPKAKFSVMPETGHFLTNFLFDARVTFDDEDSLETLKFRWDFQDDGLWDTPYLNEPTIYHQFKNIDSNRVNLEVMDPSRRSGSTSQVVKPHRTDTCIVPDFTWSSETGRAGDIFIFDASSSYHQTESHKTFVFKWLFPEQEYTEGSIDPILEHQFNYPGKKRIILLIEDDNGLQNTLEKELFVSIENVPPKPKINTPIRYGNIETLFYLNAWESTDDHTAPSQLLFRWDFDGDGNWDTNKSTIKELYYQYTAAGTYTCILEAEDEEGLCATTSFVFEVSSFDFPTGYIKDSRDGKLYGTVKIGDQWWMSENLDYRFSPKMGRPMVQLCYDDEARNCDLYGSLYLIDRAMDFINNGGLICPKDWHIPSRSEINDMMDNIDFPNGMHALVPSGSSGFNALFSGFIHYEFIWEKEILIDTVYRHKDISFATQFLTSSYRPSRVPPNVYTLQIQKNYNELYPRETNMQGFYSLRCVKD